ncbi:MAG: tRNA uridine-5-carboxymethylaminomethyl(34) synthesis GTPase MnmE [Candidatus Krumholzibacteriota bacterium]|nr:tRNA uridine-5-carboxymethylaminomethyl(34) synthesis GTPase MnmE [Candidatus Krumholzibacteriota bacterium]
MHTNTIVSLSTPPGESAIAVVRLSGGEAARILDAMSPGAAAWPPRRLRRTTLAGADGAAIDEVAAVVMQAPDSFTGEDMVEIFCHGSVFVAGEIVAEAMRLGAAAAAPGEFTRRAFSNGKIDLVQAEAVADLIAAETRLARDVALGMLRGGLSRRLEAIEDRLRTQLALVEASIDFVEEEEVGPVDREALGDAAAAARGELGELAASARAGGRLRGGIRVTITGPRNAGKSSIYNALLGEERAIVSALPGTTRDLLRERIHIGGFAYHLEDTAGLADTACEIEERGMAIGREAAARADIVLFVVDGHEGWTAAAAGERERLGEAPVVRVFNKADLGLRDDVRALAGEAGEGATIVVSAKTGEGLDCLRALLHDLAAGGRAGWLARERIAVNARQGEALSAAAAALGRLGEAVCDKRPAEILSIELREAIESIGRVTGREVAGRILDEIFSRFCIGK